MNQYSQYYGNMAGDHEVSEREVVAGLGALAQETRLAAFRRLLQAGAPGMPQGELARALCVPPQTLSFHLRLMSQAGIVSARREGTTIRYAVDFASVRRLARYLMQSCCVASRVRPARGRRS